MFLALLSDLHFANKYQTMEHIYLEHHTYLKNDHNFAIIEKRKKAAEVYIPSNWYQVARVNKPYEVMWWIQKGIKNMFIL